MLRLALAGVALALLPKACVKKKAPDPAPPAPVVETIPITSATTPPIWHPPDPAGLPTTTSAETTASPPPSAELARARVAADAKDYKKVRSLLEKKVRGGKCAPEESQLLYRACVALKDKACVGAVKAKHPDDLTD